LFYNIYAVAYFVRSAQFEKFEISLEKYIKNIYCFNIMGIFTRESDVGPFNEFDISTWTYKNRAEFKKKYVNLSVKKEEDRYKSLGEFLEKLEAHYRTFPEIVETIIQIKRAIVYLMKNDGIQFFSAINHLNKQIQREVSERRKKAVGSN
jgi:hypothetical protein